MTLREARIRMSMTQQSVGERLSVAEATYGCWERGDKMIPENRKRQMEALFGTKEIEYPEFRG